MANRFPLIVDSSSQQIKELPDGDSLLLGDNENLIIGDGLDATIFSDGSNGYARGFAALQNKAGDKDYIAFADGGATSLYFNNAVKLATNSGGATVTGTLITDGLSMSDNETAYFGTGNDLRIYHDGSNSYVKETNTSSDLLIQSNNIVLEKTDGENMIHCAGDGSVQLYYNGSSKVATDSNGAIVTGFLSCTTGARINQVSLTSASSVSWDALTAANAYLLLGHNVTFAAPTNALEGAIISVEIAQPDATASGPHTVAWNTIFEFAASTAPTMTATGLKTDIFSFRYNGTVWQEIGRVQNLAQT